MPEPRISVIVPVHRDAGALAVALPSILGQTRGDFEVIVAGDGADAAVERSALSTGDPRVRWIGFPKAPGFGYSNRARAVAAARGEWIAYLAPDDLWTSNHLRRLLAGAERGFDFVFSRPILVWPRGSARPHFLPFDWASPGPAPPRALLCCLSPTQVMHTKEIHDRAGKWSDAFARHGDVDLWLRMRAAGARVGYLDDATSLRFPSYAFRGKAERRELLHREFAERLRAGTLIAGDARRRSLGRRILGWAQDAWVAGSARGPAWGAMLLRRAGARLGSGRGPVGS